MKDTRQAIVEKSEVDREQDMRVSEETRQHAQAITSLVLKPTMVLDDKLRVIFANRSFYRLFKTTPIEIEGRCFIDFEKRLTQPAKVRNWCLVLEKVLANNTQVRGGEIDFQLSEGTRWVLSVDARPSRSSDRERLILLTIRDITERRLSEEALAESEEKFRSLAEQSPSMIFINKNGRVLYANEKCEEIMGYTQEELRSRSFDFLSLIAPEYKDLVRNSFRKHMNGEEVSPHEYALITKDGKRVEAILTSKLIRYGSEAAILGTVTDITERKRTERSVRYHAGLVEQVSDAIISTDTNFNIKTWNKAAETIYGWRADEVIGRPIAEVTALQYPYDRQDDVLKRFFETGQWTGEVIQHRKDGALIYVIASVSLIKDDRGNPIGAVAVNRDITERKHKEQALAKANEELEIKVQERTAELKKRNEELDLEVAERKRAEDRLLALSRRLVKVQEDERRNVARELHDQTMQALAMAKILLDKIVITSTDKKIAPTLGQAEEVLTEVIAQVRQMSLNLRPHILDEQGLLPTLLWHFERYTAQTKVQVSFTHRGLKEQLPPEINSAAYRIVQEALNNIARHAKVSEATVSVQVSDRIIRIKVEDRGAGFNPAMVSATSSGLSGMQERAFLLGGKLTVRTAPKKGTTVMAELPVTFKISQVKGRK